jgi:predicted transcriptional regulator
MSVTERQAKLAKKESLSIRLTPQVMRLLERYCEFIDSAAHHVIEEALKFTFSKDRDFQSWLDKNGATTQRGDSQGAP